MGKLRIIFGIIIYNFSELEFKLYPNKKKFFFRELYLTLNNYKFLTKNIRIGQNVYFKQKGNIEFGSRCCIGSFSKFWNYDKIVIGDDFLSAGCLTINTGSHEPGTLKPFTKSVNIGNRVWCGVNVTILCGVTIGDDVIIGAGSIVNKSIESGQIVAGIPAKQIKKLDRSNTKIVAQFNWDKN